MFVTTRIRIITSLSLGRIRSRFRPGSDACTCGGAHGSPMSLIPVIIPPDGIPRRLRVETGGQRGYNADGEEQLGHAHETRVKGNLFN